MGIATYEAVDHPMTIAGQPVETGEWSEVLSPYDESPIGRVPLGDAAVVERAIDTAHKAFTESEFPQHERAAVLDRAARLVEEREDDLTLTIAAEAGKPV
ncbi:MAG: aldehyde dehydrogenase family protein, partial [Solirubrobacterales bacterium]